MSTIELVILAPVMMIFILLLVSIGLLVRAHTSLDGAARDAARAGSLQRSVTDADAAARNAAHSDADSICAGQAITVDHTGSDFTAGGIYKVTVSCEVHGLHSVLGLDLSTHVTATSSAPLDTYRRTTN